jgi:hypothetical protein
MLFVTLRTRGRVLPVAGEQISKACTSLARGFVEVVTPDAWALYDGSDDAPLLLDWGQKR